MKSFCRYLLLAFSLLITLVILEYSRQGFTQDLSMQKPIVNNLPSPTYLISYADGAEYFYRNQNAMAHYALNKGIDFILNYRKSHIERDFYQKNIEIFNEKTGGGMWLWKPYIISKTLENASENAIILYLDAAFKINKPLDKFFRKLGNNDIILVHDHDRLNGSYIKGDSFALLDCERQECRDAPHIMSAAILIKNTVNARKFIAKWLESMQNIQIVSNKNYGVKENYPEFKWHHYDQSVLSLIYFNNQDKIKIIEFNELSEYMSWFHRKPSKSTLNKHNYTIYGVDPIINFNNQGKNLPSTSLLNNPLVVYIRKKIMEYSRGG